MGQDQLPSPIASLMEILRVWEMPAPWGRGRVKERCRHAPQRERTGWVLCLGGFLSLLLGRILEEVSGEGFSRIFISRIFISFPGVPFQGHGFY